jgi:hypothetical protein
LKPPFKSANSGKKQTSPLARTGNSETFEYKVDYAWIQSSVSRGNFMLGYSDVETESIFRLPLKFCNF